MQLWVYSKMKKATERIDSRMCFHLRFLTVVFYTWIPWYLRRYLFLCSIGISVVRVFIFIVNVVHLFVFFSILMCLLTVRLAIINKIRRRYAAYIVEVICDYTEVKRKGITGMRNIVVYAATFRIPTFHQLVCPGASYPIVPRAAVPRGRPCVTPISDDQSNDDAAGAEYGKHPPTMYRRTSHWFSVGLRPVAPDQLFERAPAGFWRNSNDATVWWFAAWLLTDAGFSTSRSRDSTSQPRRRVDTDGPEGYNRIYSPSLLLSPELEKLSQLYTIVTSTYSTEC